MFDVNGYIAQEAGQESVSWLHFWMEEQGGSSWSPESQAFKWFLAEHARSLPKTDYFWLQGTEKAQESYESAAEEAGGERAFRRALTAWHAWNHEFLDTVDLPNKVNGRLELVRTEPLSVLENNGIEVGSGHLMTRGANESTSLIRPIRANGAEVTVQSVPLHRVTGMYVYEQVPGEGFSAFLSDAENEVVAMLDGIEFEYRGGVRESLDYFEEKIAGQVVPPS